MAQGFFPHLARITGVDAHAGLLIGGGAAGAKVHTPVGQMIDHGHALGHTYGVMVWQDDDPEPQPDALGELAQGAEDDLRAGRHRKAGEKMVLDEPDVIKPHLIGQDALLDGFFDDRMVIQRSAAAFHRQDPIS